MSSLFEDLKREEFIKDIIKNMKYDIMLQKKYDAMKRFEKACNKKLNEIEIALFFYGYDYALQDIIDKAKGDDILIKRVEELNNNSVKAINWKDIKKGD